jgi:hypothetical protein
VPCGWQERVGYYGPVVDIARALQHSAEAPYPHGAELALLCTIFCMRA